MIKLQHCQDCGVSQYPSREFCGACLSDRLGSQSAAALPARVVARTLLHHSNEPQFRSRLPLTLGLVRFDAGPVAVCFLRETAMADDIVQVQLGPDNLLEAA